MARHWSRIRPLYADTDAAGVVYYGTYLRYLEEARTQAVEAVGLDLSAEADAGFLYPVAHVEIDYRASIRYGQIVRVSSEVRSLERVRCTIAHELVLEDAEQVAATALVELACVNFATRRPVRVSPAMRAALESLLAE